MKLKMQAMSHELQDILKEMYGPFKEDPLAAAAEAN